MRTNGRETKRYIGLLITMALMLVVCGGTVPTDLSYVNAAGEGEPSVTAFAEKSELMTVFDLDGDNDTVGKIVFGKNEDEEAQEWYIAGKDINGSVDNIVLFTTTALMKEEKFNLSQNSQSYSPEWGCIYASEPSSVYSNHYGASSLRTTMCGMLSGEGCFSVGEKNIMKDTTVLINDKQAGVEYGVTDVLYLPAGENSGTEIYVGSESNLEISNQYWDDENFWLCSPGPYGNFAALRSSGNSIQASYIDAEGINVKMAVQIDLSNVLFASSAKAATVGNEQGVIADGTAMTLRLDGSNKNIGTLKYHVDTGKIMMSEGSAGNVSFVMQGKDATKGDWYYSKTLDGTEEIYASSIKSDLGLSEDINLTECEMWLETTDDAISYAVRGKEEIKVNSVSVTGITVPLGGQSFDLTATTTTTGVDTPVVTWKKGTVLTTGTIEYNTTYTVNVRLDTAEGYGFDDVVTATMDGENLEAGDIIYNNDGTITLVKSYTSPKAKLISISAPSPVTGVANGTEKTAQTLGLPTTVVIQTEDANVTTANVAWDLNTLASGNYDPAVLEEQSFVVNGTVTLPTEINANGVGLNTTISVTVDEADTVEAPTVNVTPGTYDENQTVELSTGTTGATIYYTTDGSQPSAINGNVYNGAIHILGVAGNSVSTTITAIAMKEGMFESDIATFTYVINIPAIDEDKAPENPQTPNPSQGEENPQTPNSSQEEVKPQVPTTTQKENDKKDEESQNDNVDSQDEIVSDKEDSEPSTVQKYQVLNEEQRVYKPNENETYMLQSDGDFEKLVSVEVDGVIVENSCYTIDTSQNAVVFTREYMMGLSEGKHSVVLSFEDGCAKTEVEISAAGISETDKDIETVNKEKENSKNILWIIIVLIVGAVLLGGILIFAKSRK